MKKRTNEINIQEIEKKIGYTFKDKSLLLQAFTRTSFCNEKNTDKGEKHQSNEVLEFFGDGVLSVAIISFLLKECTERYVHGIKTELTEGDFSNIKSKLSDKQNLSKSTKALGLEKYLRMGEGDAKLGIQNEPSVMEDLFESIIGAIYIDSDMSMDAVIKSVSGMLDMSVYTNKQKTVQSAKNALQEWCADKKHRLPAPRYETLSEDGPDHKKTYMRGCYIGDNLMGRGVGKNFKIADAAAAEDALNKLKTENGDSLQTKVDNAAQNLAKDRKTTPKPESGQEPKSSLQKDVKGVAPKDDDAKKVTVTAKKQASHLAKLKVLALSEKKPSPAFRDLGISNVNEKEEYKVECIFDKESVIGVGQTRPEAREHASKLMAEKMGLVKPSNAHAKKTGVASQKNAKKNMPEIKKPAKSAAKKEAEPESKPTAPQAGKKSSSSKKYPSKKRHYTKKKTTQSKNTK